MAARISLATLKDAVHHALHRASERILRAVFDQSRLVALHDCGRERFIFLPILQFIPANVAVDVGQVVADFGDQYDAFISANDMEMHGYKQHASPTDHSE